MLLDPNEGSMALPDLRDLIEKRIPEHRTQLETSYTNLDNVAAYCEGNYLSKKETKDKSAAFEETKQYALQSLASVAYQINTLSRDLLDMLSLQTDKITQLAGHVDNVNMVVNIHKEKMARREIGTLTTNKSIPKQPKIIQPAVQEAVPRYKRTPIDYSLLDGVGHGMRVEPPSRAPVSRAPSAVSGGANNHYGHYGQYERTANIGNNTLSRSSLRSGPLSLSSAPNDHYRVPTVMPMLDPGRYSAATTLQQQQQSEYGSHNLSTPTSNDYGSQHGSSEYGGMGPMGDRYGTLRAVHNVRAPMDMVDHHSGRVPSPGLPPPPPQTSNHYGYAAMQRHSELPPPPPQLLNSTHEDDPLPPPPPMSAGGSSASNFFDTNQDWMPQEGMYIEKAIALYDYDADKADELSLQENCIVYVLRKNDDGWFEGVLDGVTGLFPGNYVRPID